MRIFKARIESPLLDVFVIVKIFDFFNYRIGGFSIFELSVHFYMNISVHYLRCISIHQLQCNSVHYFMSISLLQNSCIGAPAVHVLFSSISFCHSL